MKLAISKVLQVDYKASYGNPKLEATLAFRASFPTSFTSTKWSSNINRYMIGCGRREARNSRRVPQHNSSLRGRGERSAVRSQSPVSQSQARSPVSHGGGL